MPPVDSTDSGTLVWLSAYCSSFPQLACVLQLSAALLNCFGLLSSVLSKCPTWPPRGHLLALLLLCSERLFSILLASIVGCMRSVHWPDFLGLRFWHQQSDWLYIMAQMLTAFSWWFLFFRLPERHPWENGIVLCGDDPVPPLPPPPIGRGKGHKVFIWSGLSLPCGQSPPLSHGHSLHMLVLKSKSQCQARLISDS